MTDSATIDRTGELERKIDALTEQVQFLAEEAQAQARRRRALEDLQADLTPIAMKAVERSADSLDGIEIDPADLVQLAVRVAENAGLLDTMMVQLRSAHELVVDVMPIVNQAIAKAIELADQVEQRGYFEFAEAGIGVVDRIVTGYSKEEVEALGDNVVNILDIVKDLTQPEMLAMADRVLNIVQQQASIDEYEDEKAPGLFALAAKMRDPEIRRGLGRALNTLKAVATPDDGTAPAPAEESAKPKNENNDTPGGA